MSSGRWRWGGLLRLLLLLSLRPPGFLSSLRHHLIVFRCAAARRCICRQPPIQCGMSAIRSPAVRSPAHDDREKHARHRRVDLIVVMARPSRIYTGVTCPCELCSPRAQQGFRERFSARQLGFACAWRCRVQGTPGWNTPPSIGSSNKRPQLPQAGAVSLWSRAELI